MSRGVENLFGMSPRDLRRAMKQFGIKLEELKVSKVVLELEEGGKLVVESPQVMLMRAKGQPPMLYVIGEPVEVKAEEAPSTIEISEEDVKLVAEQAGVSLEEARKALEEAGGDIAEAILKLQGS
jgi:nascent polypeptide-associated complex subunit alpha